MAGGRGVRQIHMDPGMRKINLISPTARVGPMDSDPSSGLLFFLIFLISPMDGTDDFVVVEKDFDQLGIKMGAGVSLNL